MRTHSSPTKGSSAAEAAVSTARQSNQDSRGRVGPMHQTLARFWLKVEWGVVEVLVVVLAERKDVRQPGP